MDFILTCYRTSSASSGSHCHSRQMLNPCVCAVAMGERGFGGERKEPDGAGLCHVLHNNR